MTLPLRFEEIEKIIFLIRGQRVMVGMDLARLYGVKTKELNRQVARNSRRFPSDFKFRLMKEEYASLRCQFGTLEKGRHSKYLPHAFTEQGVAMLSSVLRSERAILVNVAIMRAFVRLKEMMGANKILAEKLAELESRVTNHDEDIRSLFETIRQMLEPAQKSERRIGFQP